jgi:TonB family protein
MNPILKAAQFNRLQVVKILVENGADVDFVDKFGNTPLMIASQKGYVDLAEYLIEYNADVNAKTLIGYTPLLYALEFGQPEIAEILIENGADVQVIDKYNRSTLIHAATRGYSELVETLVDMGVDLDTKNEKEESAAVIAQQHEFDDIVDFLVDSGADTTGLVFVDSAAVAEAELIAEMYDTPPEPIGGIDAVQKKLRYPKAAEEAGLEGTVTVRVTVDRRGRVRDTEVVESFGDEDCDTAAQRAVRGTRWKAAQKENKRVEAWVDIPVEFVLEE